MSREAKVTLNIETEQSIASVNKTKEATRALAKSLGITTREAKKLINQFDHLEDEATELARAERHAAAETKRLADEQRKLQARLGSTRKAAEAVQGPVGSMSSRLIAAGEAASALGPGATLAAVGITAVATATLGAAVGLAKLNTAAVAIIDDAETMKRLEASFGISEEQIATIREGEAALQTLSDGASAATVSFAAWANEGLMTAVGALHQLNDAAGESTVFRDAAGYVGTYVWHMTGASAAAYLLGDSAEYARKKLREQEAAMRDIPTFDGGEHVKPTRTTGKRKPQGLQASSRRAAPTGKYTREEVAAIKKHAADLAAIDKKQRAAAAEADAEKKRLFDAEMQRIQDLGDANKAFHEEEARRRDEAMRAQGAQVAGAIDGAMMMGDAFVGLAQARVDSTKEGSKAHRQAAREAFAIEQATALAQAGIHSALAVTQSFAQLGPIAGAIAAVGAGVTMAAQIATIASASPPQAHLGAQVGRSGGNAPDETMVRVRNGETVQTAQQAQRSSPAVMVTQFRHQFFDTTTQGQLRRDSVLTRAVDGDQVPGVTYGG